MDPSISRRRRTGVGGAVIAVGSVMETRMQSEDVEVISNDNSIVKKTIHLHAAEDEDKNSTNKQMSLKEATLVVGLNGKRRVCKSDGKRPSNDTPKLRPRTIGSTPPVTPRRSVGSTPPMKPRRSISNDLNDKSLIASVATKKAKSDSVAGVEKNTLDRFKKTRSEVYTARRSSSPEPPRI